MNNYFILVKELAKLSEEELDLYDAIEIQSYYQEEVRYKGEELFDMQLVANF